jgi:hypothetical protein
MSIENTLEALHQYCEKSSGDKTGQTWQGNKSTYQWKLGKTTSAGLVNGVVRKLAGIDATGHQIWAVAGSFKIDSNGVITRFTGIPKKDQAILSRVGQIKVQAQLVSQSELQSA